MANFSIKIGEQEIEKDIVGESVKIGDLVYLADDKKYYKANANSLSTSTTELKLVMENGNINDQLDLLSYGYFHFLSTTLQQGEKYYVSEQDGLITLDVYDSSNKTIRYVGTAFSQTDLLFNPDQTYITENGKKVNEVDIAGGGSTVFENDFTVNVEQGKYNPGDIITAGTEVTEVGQNMLQKIFYPTFVSPTLEISLSKSGLFEIGESISIKITANFNPGEINGKNVGGAWQPNTQQANRAGSIDHYMIQGTNTGTTDNKTLSSYTIVQGNNTFTVKAFYNTGPQPKDSDNANYDSPLPAGNLTKNKNLKGILPFFYGVSNNSPTLNQALINGGTKKVKKSSGDININFGASGQFLWFAIPKNSPQRVAWFVDSLNNGNIGSPTDLFGSGTIVNIDSPSSYWSSEDYRFYVSNYATTQNQSMQLRK